MFFVLFMFLMIAVGVTLVGLWLTPKKTQRKTYPSSRKTDTRYSSRPSSSTRLERPAYSSYRSNHVGANRRMSARKSTLEVERRAWSNIFASLNVARLFGTQKGYRETPWLGIVLMLLAIFLGGVFTLHSILPTPVLFSMFPDPTLNVNASSSTINTTAKTTISFTGASKALVRISQLDPAQYASTNEYNTWWPSACSAASMTEIVNAYTHKNYRITDILKVETGVHEITADSGLLDPHGLDTTLAKFGFQTRWLYNPLALPSNPSVDLLVSTANSGTPVIINFPPSRWDGGHLLVVIGGNKNYVYLADSSRLNMRAMDRQTFLKYWIGFAAIATPAS